MAVSFKSVGELSTERKFKIVSNEIPIGIKTPLSLGQKSDGIFSMNFRIADQIQDNFRNLLLTNHGERLGFYDFGANLRELTLEFSSEQFESEAMRRIKLTVSKYMPFIDLQSFEYTVYNVPKLQIQNKGMELSFFVGG